MRWCVVKVMYVYFGSGVCIVWLLFCLCDDRRSDMVVVVYFGMFDLLMCGYEDFVWCVLSIFDMLVVGVVDSCVKKLFFLFEECLMIVNEVFGYYLNVKVMSFIGFLKDFVCVNNVCVIVCGLCVVFDFEYEF